MMQKKKGGSNASTAALDSIFSEPLRWEPIDVESGVVQRSRHGELSEKAASHMYLLDLESGIANRSNHDTKSAIGGKLMFLACCCCVLRRWASSLSSISGKRSLKESFNSKVSLAEEPEDRAVTKPAWDDVLVTE
jgi:hypothetical protein